MSREKAGSPGFIHMGTISLLTVLLVVMLVVLSLLMLSGARQDYAYSQKLAQRKAEFYAAHNQAQRIYQQVQQELTQPEPDLSGLPVEQQENSICWQIPLGQSQSLCAQLTRQENTWKITRWQVVNVQTEN